MASRGRGRLRVAHLGMGIALAMAAACIAAVRPLAGHAQTAPASADSLVGRVVLDGQPVPGIPVTLHRVTPQTSGEVATATTDESGTFRFPLEPAQGVTFNLFFVTAEYLAVRYFGHPFELGQPTEGYDVLVYDTTSTPAEAPRIARRDMVMLPQPAGGWEVDEIISIHNPNSRAIVGAGGMPSLEVPVAETATDFLAGQGDILQFEVSFMENRVLLTTAVHPGRRDLYVRYRLPASPTSISVPVALATDTFNLYVQQPSHLTGVEGLASAQMIEVEGERFLQYSAFDLPSGGELALRWSGGSPVDPVVAAVGVTVALLAAGAWVAVRNRGTAPTA